MAIVVSWLRLDLRRRWRTLLVLTLLIAVASGTVMAVAAGARRGASANERLTAATAPATVQILPNDPAFDWDMVRRLPGVEAVGVVVFSRYELDGRPIEGPVFADAVTMYQLERPTVLEGRLADPSRLDEAVITPRFAETYGAGVGDQVAIRLYEPGTLDDIAPNWREQPSAADAARADGPRLQMRIVGVVRNSVLSESQGDPGWLIPSAALFTEYSPNLLGSSAWGGASGLVRLAEGGAGVAEFHRRLTNASGRADISMWNLAQSTEFDQGVVRVESTGLALFAVAAGVAAVVLIGQAVMRYTATSIRDLEVLRYLGLSPRQSVSAGVAGPTIAGVVGATAGVGAAVIASRWFPIGTAASREPSPGIDADWPVYAAGWPATVLAMAVASWSTAVVVLGVRARGRRPRPSRIAAAVSRSGVSLPVVLGTRFALEPGSGRSAVPVRPALFGAVVGVLGVVGAVTLSAAIDDAADNPARYGQVHQLEMALGLSGEDTAAGGGALPAIEQDPDVVAVNDSRSAVASLAGASLVVYTVDPVADPMSVVITEGRLPSSPDEVALGPYDSKLYDVGVGGRIELAGTRSTREVRVTGLAYVPEGPENYSVDGAWMTGAGFDALFDGHASRVAHIELRDGADSAAVADRLQRAVSAAVSGGSTGGPADDATSGASGGATGEADAIRVEPALERDHSTELRVIRALPVYLAGFLAALAVGAVSHALAIAVRRRHHDLAVLRALGLTRRQCRAAVVMQAVVTALCGVALGVPLGVALGRTVWRHVAEATVVHYVPPGPGRLLVVISLIVVVTAVVLAVWPGHRAASMRVGHVLRTE
ncbi:ABC transporter permease [Phytoactinopolyspora halotolerans]|uniref:FtsX-like permease family protein n=1 Tax=Phytoactinopolyspora halotolerans TaxID=1981512 RepID=A0A6L9S7I7_9ACTN|nr:FtsX-like permease family protein [Phytoactinopolyspora halotolerans]NED99929.1 FtsX-like permease family protein [Phytoactinopolyspora halotolerans]